MVAGRQLQPLYNRRHTVDNTNQQALNINNNKLNSTSQISEIKMKNDNQHNSHQSQDLMAHFLQNQSIADSQIKPTRAPEILEKKMK